MKKAFRKPLMMTPTRLQNMFFEYQSKIIMQTNEENFMPVSFEN